jgi:hypothetical protein
LGRNFLAKNSEVWIFPQQKPASACDWYSWIEDLVVGAETAGALQLRIFIFAA